MMRKFMRGSGQPSPSKQPPEKQPELFAFRKTVQHGFPHKPTALAYDARDRLMAIGTHSGAIKVFGQPGVEFYGQHLLSAGNNAGECSVQLLEFVSGSGRILSLTTANQLVLWEPAGAMLVPIKTVSFDGKLKKVSSICCSANRDLVWIGTEGGNVYQFDLKQFAIKEPVIYHDVVLEQVPATYKLNPGAIEAVRQLPTNHAQLLIAYNRGLCVVWDLESGAVVRSFISPGHGQSVGLHIDADGEHFTWYHADGSYATWSLNADNGDDEEEDDAAAAAATEPIRPSCIPYGPDPCKSINGLVRGLRGTDELVVFSGGMPRSAYGDHQCVSVHGADGSKVCLDFTSKVIDFFVTFRADETDDRADTDDTEADSEAHDEADSAAGERVQRQAEVLVVLLEEELCAFDLTDAALPTVPLPYLHSVHVSAVTCNHLQSQVSRTVYERIAEAGAAQAADQQHSTAVAWPITGGRLPEPSAQPRAAEQKYEIWLTGHEDGSVKFWDCTGVILAPLLHVRTATLFGSADANDLDDLAAASSQDELDESEPPFRKAGFFDPYSDDPRFAIKKVALCPHSGQVIIAGTAGQIVVAGLEHRVGEGALRVTTMNLVREGFVWKGHDQLQVRRQLLDEEAPPVTDGVQVVGVLQVLPPAAINALALQSAWQLLAAGTAHGLVVFDYVQHHPVMHVCTLNPKDLSGSGEVLSRRKSFKKTLRESFRRLRRGRSTRTPGGAPAATPIIETRPAERLIDARSTEDAATSMVRCLTFAKAHMKNKHEPKPSLWFGTYAYVCAYVLHLRPRTAQAPVQRTHVEKGKEITFKHHKAPIIGITVFDVHSGLPLELAHDAPDASDAPADATDAPADAPQSQHRVLIATEEQFKVYSLPEMSAKDKYKLTAKEGDHIRRMSFARFSVASRAPAAVPIAGSNAAPAAAIVSPPPTISLHAMLCLTNKGDCIIFSVPDLKKKLNAAAVRREDIYGISSLCFTNFGEALYMMSSSELQRFTLNANKVVALEGNLALLPLVEPASETDEQRSLVHRHDNRDDDDDDDDDDAELLDATLATVTSRGGPSGDQLAAAAKSISPLAAGGAASAPGTGNGALQSSASAAMAGSTLDMTTTSSVGDMTLDSIRDHLNSSTITTLHKQTTEEVVGRLAVLSTQTNQTTTVLKMSEIGDNINLPNFKDLSAMGDTTETSSSSVVIKSVITSVTTNGDGAANKDEHHEEQQQEEHSTTTTTTTKPKASNSKAATATKENGNGTNTTTTTTTTTIDADAPVEIEVDAERDDDDNEDHATNGVGSSGHSVDENGSDLAKPPTSVLRQQQHSSTNKVTTKTTSSATLQASSVTKTAPPLLRKESQF